MLLIQVHMCERAFTLYLCSKTQLLKNIFPDLYMLYVLNNNRICKHDYKESLINILTAHLVIQCIHQQRLAKRTSLTIIDRSYIFRSSIWCHIYTNTYINSVTYLGQPGLPSNLFLNHWHIFNHTAILVIWMLKKDLLEYTSPSLYVIVLHLTFLCFI